jgi:hypothetical protein
MMVKSGLDFFFNSTSPFKDNCQPARPIQPSGQIILHWAAAALKGLVEFKINISRPLFTIILKTRVYILVQLYKAWNLWFLVPLFLSLSLSSHHEKVIK